MKGLITLERALLALGYGLMVLSGGQVGAEAMPGASLMTAITGQAEAVSMTKALMALCFAGAMAAVLLKNRVITIPRPKIALALGLFLTLITVSALPAVFRDPAGEAVARWICALLALGATVMVVGRGRGPWAAGAILIALASLAALRGIQEYAAIRSIEPTYRIFGGWNNPNALASLFAAALPLAVASAALRGKWAILGGLISSFLLTFGLVLTQSKGGWAAAAIGLVVFAIVAGLWLRSGRAYLGLAGVAAGAAMAPLLTATAPQGAAGAPLTRITQSGAEQEQSATFRIQLWKSAADLTLARPILGHGPGSFRFMSAQPGLTPQTQFAHQTWLETASESGIPALAVLLFAGALWVHHAFKGARRLLARQNLLRAACLGSVFAVGAHGFFDSVLSITGLACIFFAVIGLGLLSSLDGVTPEMTPQNYRWTGVALLAGLVGAAFLPPMLQEARMSQALEAMSSRDAQAVQAASASLGNQGEEGYLKSRIIRALGDTPLDQARVLEEAVKTLPSPKVLRALADARSQAGDIDGALLALEQALIYDPNNLPALSQQLELKQSQNDIEGAKAVALTLMAIEEKPYFTVRALADLVPTETYEARLWLADQAEGAERAELLLTAARGLNQYGQLTVPVIKRFQAGGQTYAGETLEGARMKLQKAEAAAKEAMNYYLSANEPEPAEESRNLASELASVLSGID
jgi:O-antigen ligase/tetratricopeptide (TPR) repeat protein